MFRKINLVYPSFMVTHIRRSSSLLNEAREKLKTVGDGHIHLDKDDGSGIATITIDNPTKKNAISGNMMTQFENVVDNLEKWQAGKGVILRSVGNIFCSGGDLSRVDGVNPLATPHDGLLMSTFMHHTFTRLFTLPLLTMTLIDGKAIGGGAELTTATDFRLFTPKGEVAFVQGRMGVVTGWGGGTRLVKIVGPQIALDLLTSSRKLKGDDALRIGFADHIITDGDEFTKAKQWFLERLIYHSTVIQSFKKIVVGARDSNLGDSLTNERKIFSPLWGGPINLEALSKNIKHK